jgi:intein/homing endonuclease
LLVEQQIAKAWKSKNQEVCRLRLRGRNVDAASNHACLRVRLIHIRTTGGPCSTEGCAGKARARGVCWNCYHQLRRHGALPKTYPQVVGHELEWARLDELQRGDLVVVLDEVPERGEDAPTLCDGTAVTAQLAWLLGAIVGDGTVTGDLKGIRVAAFGEFGYQVADAFREVWGVRARPHPTAGLIVNSVGVARMLNASGLWCRGADKCVPEGVWRWSRRLKLAFCAGYAAADGSVGRDGLSYDSSSRRLIDEVRTIHLEAGHRVSNVRVNRRVKPITIKGKLVRNALPLYSFVVSSTEREPYTKLAKHHGHVAKALTGGVFGLRVVLGVEPLGVEPTYGLDVTENHNFIADGVVVHNSGSRSCRTQQPRQA